jgi:hypothetical protein
MSTLSCANASRARILDKREAGSVPHYKIVLFQRLAEPTFHCFYQKIKFLSFDKIFSPNKSPEIII